MTARSQAFAPVGIPAPRGHFQEFLSARSSKALPPSPNQDKGAHVSKSYDSNPKTICERIKLTNVDVRSHVSAVLYNFPAKKISAATGSSVQTAENARQGVCAMSLPHFLNACREIPELRALAIQLMGAEAECDPEFIRGLHHLINSYVRRE